MHVPDGFLDVPTSLGTAAVALAATAAALRGARRELDERSAPLAGLVATFVFAGQMVNFPVAAGTSGHLIGATLAAVLVGPWTATLCLTVVLLVQALLFADGGLTALGTNVTLMGVVAVWIGYAAFRATLTVARRLAPGRIGVVAPCAAIGGLVSVPAAAAAFAGLFAIGGTAPVDLGLLLAAMTGVHVLIGLGEAAITGLVVASVLGVRPDLVHGARSLRARSSGRILAPAPQVVS
ncbi:MAG TPA: energy-coupling factor ABC transporter permease [Dermatophilaceae bacterium]|nr:energy-coupling factor ABC transporter permease [Dermatophilaceae bacterium]